MKSFFRKDWFFSILSVILCFVVSFPFLGKYYLTPNDYMYVFGGDGLTLYYNFAYHICHGHGDRLTNMNYPYGEMVFLTDAQGAFSTLLQWINRNLFDICDCSIGAIHFINLVFLFLCTSILYYIFRAFKVSNLLSILFSVSITLLSPHIIRISGHFGLAYPFIIPLVILWIIRKFNISKWEYRDIILWGILVFFTFNNPYIGLGAIGFMLSTAMFFLISKYYNVAKKILIVGITAIVIPLLYFKNFDNVTDRIKEQWGYFFYQASIEGLFTPNGSLINQLYQKFFHIEHNPQIESWINLGIVTTILLLTFIVFIILSLIKKNKFELDKPLIFIILGGVLMFAYAAGWLFAPFKESFIEDKLGFLLMFKAVARLAWSTYFVLSIFAVVFFSKITENSCKCCLYIPLGIFIFFNYWEIHDYILPNFENKYHDNFFSKKSNDDIRAIIKSGNVNIDDYQAMLCLPKQMFWSDNILSEINFNSQFYGNRISLATGIPQINSMLSRVSVGQSAEAIELISNPLIDKSLPLKFPNQKDILLLLGADHLPLSKGEVFLISISDTILKNEHFTLFKLPISKLNENKYIQEARNSKSSKLLSNNFIYNNFDEDQANLKYFGKGAKKFSKGEHVIFENSLENPTDTSYQFSIWTNIDHEKYGIGDFQLIISNEKNEIVFEKFIETRRSGDIHDDWIRSEADFPYRKGDHIKIIFKANRNLILDEFLIRPNNEHIKILGDGSFLFDGFKIKNNS